MKPHKIVLALCVAACIAFVACRTMSQGAGIAGGAAAGSLVGPGGAAIGAVAGYYGGDAVADTMGADPQVTLSQAREILNQPGGVSLPDPWWMRWQTWVLAAAVFRFRAAIVPFFGSLLTGGFKAAGLTAVGVAIGGKLADVAKQATAMHVDARRRRKSPISNPRQTVGEHPA